MFVVTYFLEQIPWNLMYITAIESLIVMTKG
jgi:hypothetical protein